MLVSIMYLSLDCLKGEVQLRVGGGAFWPDKFINHVLLHLDRDQCDLVCFLRFEINKRKGSDSCSLNVCWMSIYWSMGTSSQCS